MQRHNTEDSRTVVNDGDGRCAALDSIAARFNGSNTGVLRDRVYSAIRNSILSGDLEPGTWIREAELTSLLDVSRTPLREALLHLVGEGLLASAPSKGVMVRGVDLNEIREIYEILQVLEAYAVELAAINVTSEQLHSMKEALDLSEFFIERERWEDVTKQGVVFHSILYEATQNRELASLIEGLRTRVHAFRRFGIRSKSHLLGGLEHHRAILDSISNRDGSKAAAQMKRHLQDSVDLIAAMQERDAAGADGVEAIETQDRF